MAEHHGSSHSHHHSGARHLPYLPEKHYQGTGRRCGKRIIYTMKFTNGFWLTRADYDAQYVKEIYKWDVSSSSLTLFAPFKKIEGRGDTLHIGMMTITCSSPAENVLRIRLTGHAG